MIKESKDVDFYTTGRQPTAQDFARISEWIKINKQKLAAGKDMRNKSGQRRIPETVIAKNGS